jgi:transposase
LPKTQGIVDFDPGAADAAARLDAIEIGDGRPLAPYLKREIVRELERSALVMRQIDQVETERDAVVQACDAGAGTDALAAEPEREAAMIGELNRLVIRVWTPRWTQGVFLQTQAMWSGAFVCPAS